MVQLAHAGGAQGALKRQLDALRARVCGALSVRGAEDASFIGGVGAVAVPGVPEVPEMGLRASAASVVGRSLQRRRQTSSSEDDEREISVPLGT